MACLAGLLRFVGFRSDCQDLSPGTKELLNEIGTSQGRDTDATLDGPYEDLRQQEIPFGGRRSFYLTPWRAYMDTWPAKQYLDCLGINFNVNSKDAEAVATVLADAGFRSARVEFGWGNLGYDDAQKTRELRDRIARAIIQHVTPVNLYALSLIQGAEQKQTLSVRIENQLNRPVKGMLTLRINRSREQTSAHFAIEAGGFAEVQIGWPGVLVSVENRYSITLTARLDDDESQSPDSKFPLVVLDQWIAVAKFVKQTINLSGSLDDLKGMIPVMMDSQAFENGSDPTRYLLNPTLEQSVGAPDHPRVVGRVYTAYDDTDLYLAAVVHEDQFRCLAGQPVSIGQNTTKITLPYKEGMPDGLHYITTRGNVFQF
jgi:hypothetical protein